ncbi:GCN5-related N-acetyltransferase [Stanieria cyanosphaera PCC 7437]|uniref:GCN5-related N-acetyltransferase n=1 Tax=Stanieria cyanosphaera (strain ATCC 29371 / PCC 7437) TaxID=111780 RepID=K9XVQ4_STAC7|nr:GNAT family N-acetyltransferase [Stanieria cyanosphaera]AFZ36149.1 GCN5-related N-acetyltransferase [Stanieria cyanosphaera PCC 7437]
MEIVTKRFLLRDFIEEDESAFFAYHADPRYAQFCAPEELTFSYTHQLLSLFYQWAIEHPRRNYQLAVASRRTSELIGCCGLRCENHNSTMAEIGIELAPQFWSHYAYAIEIGHALIEFGFKELGLQEIRGVTVSANMRVARLAHRYGFIPIGKRSSPEWMVARGWSRRYSAVERQSLLRLAFPSQTEWQLTKESWEKIASKDNQFSQIN